MAAFADGELSGPWAARVPAASLLHPGALRLRADVTVCDEGDSVWLRGEFADADLDIALRGLPGAQRHRVDDQGRVVPTGKRVPACTLPRAGWQPLPQWLAVALPMSSLPGRLRERIALRLRAGGVETEANLLLTTLAMFAPWATVAANVRVQRLAFAVDASGRALVRGTPLPPLPGRLYVEHHGVALPCGCEFEPRLPAAIVARVLRLEGDEVALFAADGSCERVPANRFVRASRSAVRATLSRSHV